MFELGGRCGRSRLAAGGAMVAALSLLASVGSSQPFGIGARTSNTALVVDAVPTDTPSPMKLVAAFPRLKFNVPVYMVEGPDDTARMYVVERRGRIRVFTRSADPDPASVLTFLNIENQVFDNKDEYGMFGLAFDPEYANPASTHYGQFYVLYKPGPDDNAQTLAPTRISRFTNPNPAGNAAVPIDSEQVLLEWTQPAKPHTAGWMDFGPDGMLYFSAGDGEYEDPGNLSQSTASLNGKMNRIDVRSAPDPGKTYHIPPDNPYVGVAGARGEVWARGFRNPFRASFDKLSGLLYTGDVGESGWEEVNIVLPGRNYGWRRMEGYDCFVPKTFVDPNPKCNNVPDDPITFPIKAYTHQEGWAVTPGYVYYGTAVPQLYGHFIYADYVYGKVWELKFDGSKLVSDSLLLDSVFKFAAFAQDKTGEVYAMEYNTSAGFYMLRPTTPTPTPTGTLMPNHLGELPALLNAGKGIDQTSAGILPYAPISPLWSDGALKERFLALPGTSRMTYTAAGGWTMPDKTLIVKNFLLPLDDRNPTATAKRIETRVLYKLNSAWSGFSYEWDDTGTDAYLLGSTGKQRVFQRIDANGTPYSYTWTFPSRDGCFQCHTTASNVVLGLCTAQMNSSITYPASGVSDNQLRTLDHIGAFTAALPAAPANLPRMVNPHVAGPSLTDRAKSYLAANCAMCHQPNGGGSGALDLRWETALAAMNVLNVVPANSLGIADARVISPGHPEKSTLQARMDTLTSSIRMPRVGSTKVDTQASTLMRDWIVSLAPTPTPTPAPGATPRTRATGLSVMVESVDSAPSFVAYFVDFGGGYFAYQGDSGWINSAEYDITFQNWPYNTLPLRLQAYGGNPSGGVAGIYPIGSTTLVGTVKKGT